MHENRVLSGLTWLQEQCEEQGTFWSDVAIGTMHKKGTFRSNVATGTMRGYFPVATTGILHGTGYTHV